MLSAEAARLAALEVLCPTSALAVDADYPTLAGAKVFDGRLIGIDDLDREAKFTPSVSLFTPESHSEPRGELSVSSDAEAHGILEVVAELAVASTDDDGLPFADAMAGDDWDARLVLAALCAQIRRLLCHDPRGYLFRRFVRQVLRVSEETFAIPQLGARWHRVTMKFDLSLPDDEFEDASGLPRPIADLVALVPANSIARQRLMALSAYFGAIARESVETITLADEAEGNPIASATNLDS